MTTLLREERCLFFVDNFVLELEPVLKNFTIFG